MLSPECEATLIRRGVREQVVREQVSVGSDSYSKVSTTRQTSLRRRGRMTPKRVPHRVRRDSDETLGIKEVGGAVAGPQCPRKDRVPRQLLMAKRPLGWHIYVTTRQVG